MYLWILNYLNIVFSIKYLYLNDGTKGNKLIVFNEL